MTRSAAFPCRVLRASTLATFVAFSLGTAFLRSRCIGLLLVPVALALGFTFVVLMTVFRAIELAILDIVMNF